MGAIWAHRLPDYFRKWGVKFNLMPDWQTRSRSSGGWDDMMGVGIHHDASSLSTTLAGQFGWSCVNSPDRPIGNGSLGRDGVFNFWAGGASNTQGRGGPVLSSRGVVPLDSGNRRLFSIEADNNGIGEVWTPAQNAAYPLLVASVLDWANHETPGAPLGAGDTWAHFEWSNPLDPYGPSRKIDPWGPSDFTGGQGRKWDMDAFRGRVFHHLLNPPGTVPPSPPPPPEVDDMTQEQLDQLVERVAARVWQHVIGTSNARSLLNWSAIKAGEAAATAKQIQTELTN